MGLFSGTKVDQGIASLFASRTKKEDLVKQREEEHKSTIAPNEQKSELVPEELSGGSEDEERESSSESEASEDLEDEYMRRIAMKDQAEEPVKEEKPSKPREEKEATGDSSEVTEKVTEMTIFVKNVPNTVITDKQVFKEFKKLFGPGIQSVRFRSISVAEMLPRKVAFIKQKLHPSRDAVNSYIVYKSKDRYYEVLNTMNRHEFQGHHLFVDSAVSPRPQSNSRSVFIGNLPFDASEEQLYQQFADCGEIENLRIVRDRKFNLGKGFAYVQFTDVSNVQLALLKNGKPFEGRNLRVTRCSKRQQQQQQQQQQQKGGQAPTKKRRHAAAGDKPFKEKQTERSKHGKPKRSKLPEGTVFEGERAKAGDKINLGRKRKARHDKTSKPKKARK